MAWAKAQSLGGAKFHLGLSGLSAPPPELLPLDALAPDLQQRGRHLSPVLAERMAERLGVHVSQTTLTLGTSHAIYLLCASRLSPGDLCLVETPAYEMLGAVPPLFGARVERFERSEAAGWRAPAELPDLIRAKRPAMVLMSNPHNPTGVLLSRAELAPIVAAVEAVGSLLVVDEVYLEFVADPMRSSAFSSSPNVAIASSFTKALGLGTVRMGWMCAAPEVVAAALTYNDYISVLYPNPCAWVGLAVLDALAALKQRATEVSTTQLPIVEAWIAARDDVQWHRPDVGVVGFLRLPMADTQPFVERLLAERDTLVVPGAFFGAPDHVRLGFGGDRATLEQGLTHLGSALDAYREQP